MMYSVFLSSALGGRIALTALALPLALGSGSLACKAKFDTGHPSGDGDPLSENDTLDTPEEIESAEAAGDDPENPGETSDDPENPGELRGAPENPVAFVAPPPADVRTHRLCPSATPPATPTDRVQIECTLDGDRYAPANVTLPADGTLRVLAYNIERGFKWREQLEAIDSGAGGMPRPDIILLSEADRGCARTGFADVPREYAQRLSMNYAYATEFVERFTSDPAGDPQQPPCEHGNALLARFPLYNVRAWRHATQRDWSLSNDEPRYGGRVTVVADLKVGDRWLRAYTIHFESEVAETTRGAQALETAEEMANLPYPAIAGGDFNSGFYAIDMDFGTRSDRTAKPFLERGMTDTHAHLPRDDRATHGGMILDLIMVRGFSVESAAVGPDSAYKGLSDHRPVWAVLRWR